MGKSGQAMTEPTITVHPLESNKRPVGFAAWPKEKKKKKKERKRGLKG